MKLESTGLLALGIFGMAAAACGYTVHTSKKMDKLIDAVEDSIERKIDKMDVDIPEALVKEAVKTSVRRAANKAAEDGVRSAISEIRTDMRKTVKDAVEDAYKNIEDDVAKEISKQVGEININEIKRKVREEAVRKANEKFEGELDSVLSQFNDNLNNLNRIYGSIANSVSGKSDDKTVSFKIS